MKSSRIDRENDKFKDTLDGTSVRVSIAEQQANLKIIVDETDCNNSYIGIAKVGSEENNSVWRIKKVVISGNVSKVLFADGDDLFNNVWTDRASYLYS